MDAKLLVLENVYGRKHYIRLSHISAFYQNGVYLYVVSLGGEWNIEFKDSAEVANAAETIAAALSSEAEK